MRQRILQQVVALFLAFIMVFMSVPSNVLAMSNEKIQTAETLPIEKTSKESIAEKNISVDSSNVSIDSVETSVLLEEKTIDISGARKDYPISIDAWIDTSYSADWTYFAALPEVISFFDNLGRYNVVYENQDTGKIHIQRYDSNMNLVNQFQIAKRYPLFGNITCDNKGYYYVVWGQVDENSTNCVTMCVSKYNYSGKFVKECKYKGYDTWDSYWGTKVPFRAGNCSLTINNGILACNYAREMYSGHQSNYVLYVNCETMTRIMPSDAPYCSHSFDQRVISTSDGGFLMASQGDAYDRSFMVFKVNNIQDYSEAISNFHFREGANRDHGYNETYAQLGGIAETTNAYVFCGSSERTLSIDTAPTNQSYCGHSEARDLFIQILKKDFYNYSGANCYLVNGATRTATGERPYNALTKLYLTGNEKDYGIIWLTDYEDSYYAANPKVIATENDKIVIMWEKLSYDTHTGSTYYAVVSENGKIYQNATELKNTRLAGNIDPVYHNGNIYWTTSEYGKTYVHQLNEIAFDRSNVVPQKPYKITNVVSGVHVYWKAPASGIQKYGLWRSETGKDGTYKWVANPAVPHYTDTTVESGKTYYYKVTVCDPSTNTHGKMSEALGIQYVSTPDITNRYNKVAGVQLEWNKVNGATGYGIYRKSYDGDDAWVRIATIKDNNTFKWIDTSVKANNGTLYRYTIRALAGTDRKTLSGCRNAGRTMVRLASRIINSVVQTDVTSVKCSWTTSSAVNGYEIRVMDGNKVYKTAVAGGGKTGVKTITGLENGKTYKIQVRSYKKVAGVGTFYSAWSTAKNVTLK